MRSRTKLTDKIKLSEFDMAGIIEKWLIHHHVEVENFFYNWPESRSLILDAMVLSKINADMIEYVIEKPEKVLEMVRGILLSDAVDNPTDSFIDFPEIRIRNIPNRITPSGIRDGDVGTLVAVECQVRSASKILPKAKVVFVRCVRCGHVWNVDVPYRGDPSVHVCPNNACNRTGPFTFIDEREVRTSSERFIIQDPFDAAVGSATAAFEMEVEGDLVDCARAGDRIIANCIVCTEKKSKSPIRSIYLKCISVETDTNSFDDKPLTKEEIESFQALGEQGNLIPQIVKSIAPDIYGMEDVKEAIALQLASCPSVPMDGGMKLRGDIHMLLVGDPGCTAFSHLVTLSDGTFMRMGRNKELEGKHVRVNRYSADINPLGLVIGSTYLEKRRTLLVKTNMGKELILTPDHPLWCKRSLKTGVFGKICVDRGWVRADELVVGDKLKTIKQIHNTKKACVSLPKVRDIQPSVLEPDVAWAWGYLIGDGHVRKYHVEALFNENDRDLEERYIDLMAAKFGINPRVEMRLPVDGRIGDRGFHRSVVVHKVVCDSVSLAKLLAMPLQPDRLVPDAVLESPRNVVSGFLSGLFDADGSIHLQNGKDRSDKYRVSLKSSSRRLLHDVQVLLMQFGIQARVNTNTLWISRQADVEKFILEIGFTSEKKKAVQLEAMQLSKSVQARRHKALLYETVTSVSNGPDVDVYDIEVEKEHSFYIDGLASHNCAKSQLLRYVSKIAHRGRYTSGRGSTAAGLSAIAVKDEDDRWSVEAGFLPLCHDGLAAIDEFNLMKAEDRSALLEAMESGTVSVSKASISATLPAKATILAAGNPVNSRIDVHVPIVEQINIPTTILSRFDLIFILLDSHNKEQDEALAHHIGALRRGTKSSIDPPISLELLRRYISHVKKLNDFQVTEEAEKMLIDFHLGMRSFNDYKGAVPVTPRQLEAMFRLATASARLRMSPSVEKQDAERAIRLSRASLLSSGIDPESGALDADAIYTGVPKSQADATKVIEDAIVELSKNGGNAKLADIISEAARKGIKPDRVEKILDRLRSNGNIFSPSDNTYRHTWRR